MTTPADDAPSTNDARFSENAAASGHSADFEYGDATAFASPRWPLSVRIVLVGLALTLAWALVGITRNELLAPNLPFDFTQAAQALITGTLGVSVIVLACRLLDRRSIRSLGLGSLRTEWRALVLGAGLWLTLGILGLAVGAGVDAFRLELGPPTGAFLGWLLLQLGLVFCLEAFPEELALRGYIYTNLVERLPRWVGIVGQAVIFTLWAFSFVGLQQALGYDTSWSINIERVVLFVTFGLTLAFVRLWTGSLWGAIGFHWAFQTVTQLLAHDRLVIARTPGAEDLANAQFFCWLFPILMGGGIAWWAAARRLRRG